MTRPLRRLLVPALLLFTVACASQAEPAPSPTPTPTWKTIGELSHPRAYASAVALSGGLILVVGGLDRADPEVMNRESELFDTKTGTSTVLPQKLVGRLHQTITVAAEDRVVVTGGVIWRETYWEPVGLVDVFIPSERRWIEARPLWEPRSDHSATALRDGRVLVVGGNSGTKVIGTTEIYDPKLNVWNTAAKLPRPRTQHSAVALADGRVLVAGGIEADGEFTDTTFFYDPRADKWTDGPKLVLPRVQHVAVPLPNGDVLFVGGEGAASGTSERYDARQSVFVRSGTLVVPRVVAQGAALPDGRVVIAGGLPPRANEFTPLRSGELWDPATGSWRELPPSPSARASASVLVVNGSVYVLSGTGEGETAQRTIERLAVD